MFQKLKEVFLNSEHVLAKQEHVFKNREQVFLNSEHVLAKQEHVFIKRVFDFAQTDNNKYAQPDKSHFPTLSC
jgi:hypothetical protein